MAVELPGLSLDGGHGTRSGRCDSVRRRTAGVATEKLRKSVVPTSRRKLVSQLSSAGNKVRSTVMSMTLNNDDDYPRDADRASE